MVGRLRLSENAKNGRNGSNSLSEEIKNFIFLYFGSSGFAILKVSDYKSETTANLYFGLSLES
jgi:hypothetical protein